jgi:hypothetical protein
VLLDGGGNPIASADGLTPFSPGCPPAGTVKVGTVSGNCGDDRLSATLAAGTYTILLSDANFVPLAVDPQIPGAFDLTDTTSANYGSPSNSGAYTDLSGGAFQTCVTLTDCNSDNGNFAVDVTEEAPPTPVPEPRSLVMLAAALGVLAGVRLSANRRCNGCA